MNPAVNWFFDKDSKWQDAYALLRTIVLESGLEEELKWGCPCYTFEKNNVLLIHGFKNYCALLFIKGALLKDDAQVLVQQTVNVQAARQMRFTSADQIEEMQPLIKSYIEQAIAVEKAGLKVELKSVSEYHVPQEFQAVLDDMPELKAAFEGLTPGRQRGYLIYFAAPKQSKTREARIEKYLDKILAGKGLDD